MIDLTFLLLIFFLVTTTFERAEGVLASELPEVGAVPAVPLPISPIVIRLAQPGPGHEDFTIGIDRFENVPDSFDALPDYLRLIHRQPGFDKQTPVVIVAERNVRWDHVVSCWNAALRAGCERIAFGKP
jgi:biopolymer transport protein ExbD